MSVGVSSNNFVFIHFFFVYLFICLFIYSFIFLKLFFYLYLLSLSQKMFYDLSKHEVCWLINAVPVIQLLP